MTVRNLIISFYVVFWRKLYQMLYINRYCSTVAYDYKGLVKWLAFSTNCYLIVSLREILYYSTGLPNQQFGSPIWWLLKLSPPTITNFLSRRNHWLRGQLFDTLSPDMGWTFLATLFLINCNIRYLYITSFVMFSMA